MSVDRCNRKFRTPRSLVAAQQAVAQQRRGERVPRQSYSAAHSSSRYLDYPTYPCSLSSESSDPTPTTTY
eukprot:scaffold192_cov320-Ochromonas_danica.AAC.3